MELKTLKDFEEYSLGIDGHVCPRCNLSVGGHELNYCDCKGVVKDELKQEAIKWIKELGKEGTPDEKWDINLLEGMKKNSLISRKLFNIHEDFYDAIAVLMTFNNITEEDLK